MAIFLYLSSVLLLVSHGYCASLPSSFPVCKRTQSDLNDCFAKAVEKTVKLLKNPIPELSIPSIEPLEIASAEVSSGGGGNIKIDQKLTNLKIYNLAETVVPSAEVTLNDKNFVVKAHADVSVQRIVSDYDMTGQILLLPLSGKGKCEINIEHPNLDIILTGDVVDKKGTKYLKLLKVEVEANPTIVKYHFDNLFNGDKTLGDEMNKVLNENWKEVFSSIKDAYIKIQEGLFFNIGSQVLNKIPYDELFPV